MRSYLPALVLTLAGLFAPLAEAAPQRLYLPPQPKIILTSTGKLRIHCADGPRRPAPEPGEKYTGLYGDVWVNRKRKGDSKPSGLPLAKAIEAEWVRLEGLGNASFLRIVNLHREYEVTVDVRKGSLVLPTPKDLSKEEKKHFNANLAALTEVVKKEEALLRALGDRGVADPSPLVNSLSPPRTYGELLVAAARSDTPALQRVLYIFARILKGLAAKDQAVLWRLFLGKEPNQAFRDFLKDHEKISEDLLPPLEQLDEPTTRTVGELIRLPQATMRTLPNAVHRYMVGHIILYKYKEFLPHGTDVSAADRLTALRKTRAWLVREHHKRDCKACERIACFSDVLLHLDGPECFISRVTEKGRQSDQWSPKSEIHQAIDRYRRDLKNRSVQLLEKKADWLERRLHNKDSEGNNLKEGDDGLGYLPLLHDIVSRIPEKIQEPTIYIRASSAAAEIDFAFLYGLVQTAGVRGYEREVNFVLVPDSGLRADPMRHAIENMRRQANFKDIRSVMALLLPKDKHSFDNGLTGRWLKNRLLWKFERPQEGGRSIKEDVLEPFIELARHFFGNLESPAFVHDPETTAEYWKRVGQAFAGHTGDGALVNVRFGHSSDKGEYLYLRDERITWSEFLRKRPSGIMPRNYIEADFRCYAGGSAENLLVGPSAATLVISPVGEIDAVEAAHFCKAYLQALKETSPAKAHGRAVREYLKDLRQRLQDEKAKQPRRYHIEIPQLQGRRPHPAWLGRNDSAA